MVDMFYCGNEECKGVSEVDKAQGKDLGIEVSVLSLVNAIVPNIESHLALSIAITIIL